jgi:hypothetical protein
VEREDGFVSGRKHMDQIHLRTKMKIRFDSRFVPLFPEWIMQADLDYGDKMLEIGR